MSFSEFYQRSITQPASFWAEQARRIDWAAAVYPNAGSQRSAVCPLVLRRNH